MFDIKDEPLNWKKFVSILGASCLCAGILMGVIIYYLTKPPDTPVNLSATTSSQSEKDMKIKGNKNSRIYHLNYCPNYNDIAEKNIVWFKSAEEAEKAGFRMARNC